MTLFARPINAKARSKKVFLVYSPEMVVSSGRWGETARTRNFGWNLLVLSASNIYAYADSVHIRREGRVLTRPQERVGNGSSSDVILLKSSNSESETLTCVAIIRKK